MLALQLVEPQCIFKGQVQSPQQGVLLLWVLEGELEAMLMSAAAFYERELERRRGMLAKFLEPALIILMGCIVGVLVLSVLLPLAQISSQLQV